MKPVILVLIMVTSIYASTPTIQTPPTIGEQWEVYELTFVDSTSYPNPFWDVTISAEFTSPGGTSYRVRGFYYDTYIWKARFAPTEPGQWTFNVGFMRPQDTTTFSGSFTVTSGVSHGFIRINPSNPNMFSYTDGTCILPIGVNGHTPAVTAAYLGIPPGPQQVPAMWDSLEAHGVNTYRLFMFNQEAFADSFSWNSEEGSANLVYHTDSLDMYDLRVGKMMDRWFQQALSHNINIYLNMFVLFDVSAYPLDTSPWSSVNGGPFADINAPYASSSGSGAQLERDYYTYVVSRWGAYRNLFAWEYNNEYGFYSMPPWIAMVDSVIKANDPYGRPHSVSFWNYSYSSTSSVDSLAGVNITDDHLYASNGWTESDIDSAANAQSVSRYLQYEKPVMFGEFGSSDALYGPSWLVFLRAGYWAAFTGGGYPIFWWCGDLTPAGYEFNQAELGIVSAAGKLVSTLGALSTLHPTEGMTVTNMPQYVRAYTMKGDSDVVVYLRDFSSDTTQVAGGSVTLRLPGITGKNWEAVWLDPTTGDSIAESTGTSSGDTLTLSVPVFEADALLHLRIASIGTAVKTGIQGAPSVFLLAQNFPNPFNPATMINYQLPTHVFVTLKIFDVLGREVKTLVNEEQNAGTHSVAFNAANLPSGVYFYRLQAGDYSKTMKLMLLK
jgi:Domain of unknown function (DUF5060)/Secretion system C-terminal sorting domain